MLQKEKIAIYEVDNKKYTVVTKCIENAQNIQYVYDVIVNYVIEEINLKIHNTN